MLSSTDIASPIEFPKASGIRIGAVSNKTNGKKFSFSYRVNLPAAMTGNGRVQKQFLSLRSAKDFASQQYQNARKHGHHVFSLTPDQLFDCSKALRLLEGADLRLEQIVEFALPKLKPEHEAVTVQQAVGLLLKAKSEMNLRDRTTKDLRIRLAKFCESFGNRSIAEVTAEDILDWIRCLGLAPRTRRNYYQTIRTLYSWAKDEKMIKEDPLALVPKSKLKHLFGKQDDKSPEIYTPMEAQRLLGNSIGCEIMPLIVLGFFCGLRTAELLQLDWEDVKRSEEMPFVSVRSANAKSRSRRNVELNETALEWLSLCDVKESGRIFPKSQQTYNVLRKRLHVESRVTPRTNGLRHSFGSYHYMLHGNEISTSHQLGHNPNETTLFTNYRALVTKMEGKAFFSIEPPKSKSKLVEFAG
jgi:integrase